MNLIGYVSPRILIEVHSVRHWHLFSLHCLLPRSRVHAGMLCQKWISFSNVSLQLALQLVYLVPQVGDDVLVGGYVLRNQFFVWFDSHLDIFGPISVL